MKKSKKKGAALNKQYYYNQISAAYDELSNVNFLMDSLLEAPKDRSKLVLKGVSLSVKNAMISPILAARCNDIIEQISELEKGLKNAD